MGAERRLHRVAAQHSTASIASAFVQGFNTVAGVKTPINLLSGQILILGLASKTLMVSFPNNLSGTSFDPGANNLYVTLGVSYPAGGTANLIKTPFAVDGGTLYDATSGKTLPVYGVSEYAISAEQHAEQAYQVPGLQPRVFERPVRHPDSGRGRWLHGHAADRCGRCGHDLHRPQSALNGTVNGLYIVSAFDLAIGTPYSVTSRTISGNNCVITSRGPSPSSTVVMVFLAQDTAQATFNAPVKGITEMEETVLFGTFVSNATLQIDPRVVVESVSYNSVSQCQHGGDGCQELHHQGHQRRRCE